ncbi:hypothetical protein [Massilia aquatica]|nr:hypothetical protein [Massilia aquatica]
MTRLKRLTFWGAHDDVRCLPHLDLHDRFEFVTLHFALVDIILP